MKSGDDISVETEIVSALSQAGEQANATNADIAGDSDSGADQDKDCGDHPANPIFDPRGTDLKSVEFEFRFEVVHSSSLPKASQR
ncbi:MAG: hypothetical protein AAB365_00045 [Patescibacteria group bacterium]